MKTKIPITIALALLALYTLNSQFSTCFAQGALTPPGAPAPTMKSLDQIEARTPVNATSTPGDSADLYVIRQPGSYYLTSNIAVTTNNAIAITTNGVTLDLNGFTISSTASPANGMGIDLVNAGDVTILNGHIAGGVTYSGGFYTGPGFLHGINGSSPVNVRISGISISGCAQYGIYVGGDFSSEVDHCTLRNIGNTGITAGCVNQCTVLNSGGTGILAQTVAGSYGVSTASGYGIYATSADNCYGLSAQYVGISANSVSNCRGDTTNGYGIFCDIAVGCYGRAKGGPSCTGNGLSATIANNCYGYAEGSGYGLGATIAIGSTGYSNSGTRMIVTYYYNMFYP